MVGVGLLFEQAKLAVEHTGILKMLRYACQHS